MTPQPFYCEECNAELFKALKFKEGPQEQLVRAYCPFCEDYTFYNKIQGQFFLDCPKHLTKTDVQADNDDGTKMTILLQEREQR